MDIGPGDSLRVDGRDEPWPVRPWLMAAICAVAGIAFQHILNLGDRLATGSGAIVASTVIATATVSFVLTVERRRWWWSVLFALGWGAVIGLIALSTRGSSHSLTIFDFPFFSGVFAVLIAAPLFQAVRDEGRWHLTPLKAHTHAWTDAVIGAAAILFVGIAFALAWLIGGLFQLIGITLIVTLLQQVWFGFGLAGFAFGAAVGLLRERDGLVATMQRLVMVVLGVLSPVLAAALLVFLLSLPITGLTGLWDGALSAASLTLTAAAGAYLLINAAIGHGDEARLPNPVLTWAALVLALVVLPLAALALAAMLLRVAQYGWTPQRIWGVITGWVGIIYGIAGWWAVLRGRLGFAAVLRRLQVALALLVCCVALVLALPIIDFGAISTANQLTRLERGQVSAAKFDWTAMAFDFGPAGRAALRRIARSGPQDQRVKAAAALAADNRYGAAAQIAVAVPQETLAARLQVRPAARALPAAAMRAVEQTRLCAVGPCLAIWIDADRFMLIGRRADREPLSPVMIAHDGAEWQERFVDFGRLADASGPETDPTTARVDIRTVSRRQVFVDGKPLSGAFE